MIIQKKRHFSSRDLVVIGVFAAATKVITLIVALAGGGPNPITIMLKNLIFTTLLVVLLYKVRKVGTLTLFTIVTALVSLVLLGGGVTSIPMLCIASLLTELLVLCFGGFKKVYAVLLAVFFYDLITRVGSILLSYLFMREMPAMMAMVLVIVAIGYLGALLGLVTGQFSARELRHAGIIKQ